MTGKIVVITNVIKSMDMMYQNVLMIVRNKRTVSSLQIAEIKVDSLNVASGNTKN